MKAQTDILTLERTRLTRYDLISHEHILADSIKTIIPFSSYSLYFPRKIQSLEAVWDAKDKKLLLPLVMDGKFYGQFVARGVSIRAPKTMLSVLPAVATLALEKLQGVKSSVTNAQTGLFTRIFLHHTATREIRMIREGFHPSGERTHAAGSEEYRASVGLVTLDISGLRSVETEFGHMFAEKLALELADALTAIAPKQTQVFCSGDYEYAILVPAGTSSSCRKIAAEAIRTLRAVQLVHEITEHRVSIDVAAGYAAFPQDFEGAQFELEASEQGRLLLRKSRIASGVGKRLGNMLTIPHVMGFNRLLHEGGTVRASLPVSRVIVDLGVAMGAREGQRFSVWSCNYDSRRVAGAQDSLINNHPLYKGEIVLMEIRENESVAEIMHTGDPTWPIEPTDTIKLLPEEKGVGVTVEKDSNEDQFDALTGLYKHKDFIARFTQEREKADSFALALVRLSRTQDTERGAGEQILAEATQLCRDILGSDMVGGRYGLNSLICFYPEGKPEFVQILFNELCQRLLTNLGIEAAVGVFCYPYLDYRKGDALECCLKALEYAMLLPAPRVGILDSLALNISADKLYSKNDPFGAIEEYKRALLADEDNTMAWNSLGVCYAGLGRPEEARKHFEGALKRDADDLMALYNLGHISQTIGNYSAARSYYDACLEQDAEHFFALIRLGQVNEFEKDFVTARSFFERARALEENKPLVERNFARLCIKEGDPDKAREHLHQALLYNPQDAVALELMARLYLDGGEDPEIAEVLARQAAALRPDYKGAWLQLARALEACGKNQDARHALVKAGEL